MNPGDQAVVTKLQELIALIQTRAGPHGDAVVQHGTIAALWNMYLGDALFVPLTVRDAAMMLALMKISRIVNGARQHQDHYDDLAAYAAIAAAAP